MRNAEAVQHLEQDLRSIFSGDLQTLVVYGTAQEGPVPTLAIVREVTSTELRHCAERASLWHSRGLATPLILRADEFERSLDAFPLEFGAILASYELVSGADALAGLSVDPADLRRACEVQARSHLLHLREGFMETEGRNDYLDYGAGLAAGTSVLAQRIAQGRNVELTGAPPVPVRQHRAPERSANWLLILFVVLLVLSRFTGGGPRSGVRRWGRGGWSGWSSGVGPFGGGFGGGGFGGGGGGFGGGFGGFGGGRSGGGGGGSSW